MTAKMGWASLVLGAFQPLEAAEVGRQLAEQRRLDAARLGLPWELRERRRRMVPEDMSAARLREVLARLRGAVEAVDVASGPVAASYYLWRLERPLSRIDASSLLSADDGEYHAKTLQIWESKRNQAQGSFADEVRSAAAGLLSSVEEALAAVQRIVAPAGGSGRGAVRGMPCSYTAEVRGLSEAVWRAQRLAAAIPGAAVERLPAWATLQRAITGIVCPHLANLFLYRCAALVAAAEGELPSVERDCLYAMGDAIHLTTSEATDLIESGRAASCLLRSHDAAGYGAALCELCRGAVADGTPEDAIGRGVRIAGGQLGMSDGEVEAVLRATCGGIAVEGAGSAPAHGPRLRAAGVGEVCFLDTERVRRLLKSRAEMPPMTWLAAETPADVLGRLGGALGLDEADAPLLMYEFRYLGTTGECGALTRLRLLWKPSPAPPICIGVGALAQVRGDASWGSLPIEAGRAVKPSPAAMEFLALAVTCAKVCLARLGAAQGHP